MSNACPFCGEQLLVGSADGPVHWCLVHGRIGTPDEGSSSEERPVARPAPPRRGSDGPAHVRPASPDRHRKRRARS